MTFDQRNNGASLSIPNTALGAVWSADRWRAYASVASKYSTQQNAGSVTPPAGFVNYLGATSSSAYSVGSAEIFLLGQSIEGLNVADLGWGTANAKPVTLSFWVRSSLTGTFTGSFANNAGNRSYVFNYTISSANTWEQKSVTIPGDTAGAWLTTNLPGIVAYFNLGAGSTYNGTAGSWSGSFLFSTAGAVSVVGTSGATWYITGVQLEIGTVATSFDFRSYGTELALCQRYYQTVGMTNATQNIGSAASGGNQVYSSRYFLPVTMRTAPSITYPPIGQTTGSITYLIGGSYPTPAGGTIGDQDVEPGSFNFSIQHTASGWSAMQSPILFATGASEFKLNSEI